MARRRIVPPRGSYLEKVDSLSRLISVHGAQLALKGKLSVCRCDLCKRALLNLERLRSARGK